jgi:putative DNA primase/helicase
MTDFPPADISGIVHAATDFTPPIISPPKPDRSFKGDTRTDLDLARLPQTDLGNAERFARRNRQSFMYVPTLGWLWWDGRRWARESVEERLQTAVHAMVRAIQDEAAALRESGFDKVLEEKRSGRQIRLSDALADWGRKSETANRLFCVPKLASSDLVRSAAELDADPWQINCRNGTLTINRNSRDEDPVRFGPHDPAHLITKMADVDFDPEARCLTYDRFLTEVQPRSGMRRFLHAWGGYSLTGDVGQQKLCFFYGKGKNGKSTLVDAWANVAGDYGESVGIETFLDQGRGRNAGAATPDLALLPGVRFLRTSEPEKGSKLAEALIKLVTGGEPIQARRLHSDFFRFKPSFKLTLSGNYKPSISGTDLGIWRRLLLVPWDVTVEVADVSLPEKLDAERSGILNRLLDGLRDFLDHGLELPSEVSEATASYRDDSDPLGRFLRIAVEHDPEARTGSSLFHAVFSAWARSSGERQWSPKGLSMALKERGYRSMQSNTMFWLGICLLKSESDFLDVPSPPPPEGYER